MDKNELQCTVISLLANEIFEEKPGLIPGRFYIPATNTVEPELVLIGKSFHHVYLDETRGHLQVRDSPDEVARAIVEDYQSAQLRVSEDAKPALFWVPGGWNAAEVKIKYKDEMKEAIRLQNNWFISLCLLADDDWNKYHQHNVVSSFQRRIAHLIGWKREEHEWMSPKSMEHAKRCPSCTQLVDQNMVVCTNCRCILDHDAFGKLEFAGHNKAAN